MVLTGGWKGFCPVLAAGVGGLVIWCAALLAAVAVLGAALLAIRRRYRPGSGHRSEPAGFDIEQLESMLAGGQISPEEFRFLRRSALGLDGGGGSGNNAPSSGGGDDDDNDDDESKGDGRAISLR